MVCVKLRECDKTLAHWSAYVAITQEAHLPLCLIIKSASISWQDRFGILLRGLLLVIVTSAAEL